MASLIGFQFVSATRPDIVFLGGYVEINSVGDVVNQATATLAQADGYYEIDGVTPLVIPREIGSITKTGTGELTIVLSQAWSKVMDVSVTTVGSAIRDGTWQVTGFNPTGNTLKGVAAKTIILQFQSSGSAAAFVDAGIFLRIELCNTPGAQ